MRVASATAALALVLGALVAVAPGAAAQTDPPPDGSLAAWTDALAAAETEPADVVFIGDSITHGFGATSRATWWVEAVRQQLQASWTGDSAGYIPASPSFWPDDPGGWRMTGGKGIETTGLGLRAHLLDSASSEAAITIQRDSFRLLYAVGPDRGTMEVLVDGTVVGRVDTNDRVAAGGRSWSTSNLGPGPHEVRIRPVRIRSSVKPVLLEGILDGDTSQGVRTWDAGHGGYTSTQFVQQRGWEAGASEADPELVVIELGTNDYAARVTAQEFESNLVRIIDGVQAAADGPVSVALMPMWMGEGRDPARYAPYVDVQRRLAEERGLALIDLTGLDAGLVADDIVHPNDFGQDVVANAVLDAADPRYSPPPATVTPADLVAQSGADGSTLAVSWSASPNASTYVVRVIETATGQVVHEVAVAEPTASFAELRPGTEYLVRVFAGNAAGFAPAAVTPVTTSGERIAPPAAPTDVVATHDPSSGAVEVTWTAVDGATDYAVLAYDTATGAVVATMSPAAPSATFTGLAAGTYVFGVHAHNAAGYGPGTASDVVTVPATATPPPAPTDVVATYSKPDGAVRVSWTASEGATDYAVLAYDVGTGAVVASVSVTGTTATFDGLPARTTYVFGVHAHNGSGYSPGASSNEVTIPKGKR